LQEYGAAGVEPASSWTQQAIAPMEA
jgi:hypothetical protein